jgi:hypothetical protein
MNQIQMQKNPKKKRDRDKVRQPKLNSKLYIIDLTPKTKHLTRRKS